VSPAASVKEKMVPKDHLPEVEPNCRNCGQPRGRLHDDVVERYAEEMESGLWDFAKSSAPITAFFDGEIYWLSDGFHRVAGAKKAGLDEVEVDVRQGGQRDAILYSVSANATQAIPDRMMTSGGQSPGSSMMLNGQNGRIARLRWLCHVDHRFVGRLREKLTGDVPSDGRTYKTKHGTVATMNTSAIGANSKPLPPQAPPRAQSEGHRREPVAAESTDDPCSSDVVAVPVGELRDDLVGELRVTPDLPGASDGRRTYLVFKTYLDGHGPRPSLPSRAAVEGMTVKHRATMRRLAEQSRAWAVGLLNLLDRVDGRNV
jgi:hypothetical protein